MIEWLTAQHASSVYDRPAQYLIERIKSGAIEGYRDGRPWMLSKSSADEYFARLARQVDTRTEFEKAMGDQ